MVSLLAAISYPPIPIFEVGPLRLSLHGLFAAVGFVAGAWLATRHLQRVGLDTAKYQSVLSWAIVGALLGARYLTTPAAILEGASLNQLLNPLSGNFSIMGGFVGGIVAGLIRMRQVDLPALPTLDMSSFGLALGTVVGRIGDLAIVEHLGSATELPWGYGIKPGYDVAPQHNALECSSAPIGSGGFCGVYHHVALYDLAGAAILLAVLYQVSKRFKLERGQMFSVWVVWYGFQRFLLDFLRFGSGDATVGPFTWNQVSGLAGGLLGAGLFIWFGARRSAAEQAESFPTSE